MTVYALDISNLFYAQLRSIIGTWSHSGGSEVYKHRRKVLSQNFIYNRSLINKLVRGSSIASKDTVLEIGPGKGFITAEVLSIARQVIAVELDPKLILHLQRFYEDNPRLDLYLADFLNFRLPKGSYKVFANTPFSIEGKVIRKLLDDDNSPEDSYLIIRRDLAERLSKDSTLFSVKYKPWFEFSIYHHLKRSDFIPQPSMDCVMWRMKKKEDPFIPLSEKQRYQHFVELAFGQGQPLRVNLRRGISTQQLQELAGKISFSLKKRPSEISFDQWLELYRKSHLFFEHREKS